jgi:hypothetical protein
MRTYIITFTIFGKTFKSKVKANTYTEAKTELIKSIISKITFENWELEKSDPSVDELKSFFDMK